MTAQTQRIAWAWLDKMLGREPPPAGPVSPRDRGLLLESTYEQLRDDLIADVHAEIPLLIHAETAIAAKYELDPVFLDWFVVNGKNWPPMSPKARRALRAIQSLFLWFGAVPSHWNHMTIPDATRGDDRDAATIELADWFVKNSLVRIERQFASALWKKSRELLSIFGLASGDVKASALLLADFAKRLVGDAFQTKPAVQQIVDLMH